MRKHSWWIDRWNCAREREKRQRWFLYANHSGSVALDGIHRTHQLPGLPQRCSQFDKVAHKLEGPESTWPSKLPWHQFCRSGTSTGVDQSPTLGAHTHAHAHPYPWVWVGMCAILLFMGGHGWAWVLCIPASNSKSKSNFLDAVNTLTNKRFGLKPRQWTTFYLSDPTKTWCRRVIHIKQFLNTWA
jgi:hypothetical protein